MKYVLLICFSFICYYALAQIPEPNLVADSVAKKFHVKTVQGRYHSPEESDANMIINEKYNTQGQVLQSTARCIVFESRDNYYYNEKWQLIKKTYTVIQNNKRKDSTSSSVVYTYDDKGYEFTENGDTVRYIIKNGKKYHAWDEKVTTLSRRDSLDQSGRVISTATIYPQSTKDIKWFSYNNKWQIATKKDFLYLPNISHPVTFEYSYTYNKKGLVRKTHEIEDGCEVTNCTYTYTFY